MRITSAIDLRSPHPTRAVAPPCLAAFVLAADHGFAGKHMALGGLVPHGQGVKHPRQHQPNEQAGDQQALVVPLDAVAVFFGRGWLAGLRFCLRGWVGHVGRTLRTLSIS